MFFAEGKLGCRSARDVHMSPRFNYYCAVGVSQAVIVYIRVLGSGDGGLGYKRCGRSVPWACLSFEVGFL